MKQLFSYHGKKNERVYEGGCFITKTVEPEHAKRMREIEAELEKEEATELKEPPLTPLNYALLACGFIIIAVMIYLTSAFETVSEGFIGSPVLAVVLGIACAASIVITVIDKKKRLNTPKEPSTLDLSALAKEVDALTDEAFSTLGIPADEERLEVIAVKASVGIEFATEAEALYLTVFEENGAIVLSDFITRYDFPKEAFKSREHFNRPMLLADAVKPHLKALRHEYAIEETKNGFILPGFDVFTLESEGETYTLTLPEYDGKLLAGLLNLPDTQEGGNVS